MNLTQSPQPQQSIPLGETPFKSVFDGARAIFEKPVEADDLLRAISHLGADAG